MTEQILAFNRELSAEVDRLDAENEKLRGEVEYYRLELQLSGNGKVIPKSDIDVRRSLGAARAKIKSLERKLNVKIKEELLSKQDASTRQGKIVDQAANPTDYSLSKPTKPTNSEPKKRRTRVKSEEVLNKVIEFLEKNPKSFKSNIVESVGVSPSVLDSTLHKYSSEFMSERDPENKRKRLYSIRATK